ncbi:RNase H family protein [Paenarthrobacter sp. YJN-5]|uniref:RNase H family protein n=1 Tax=Paenarthrobacter sp. YJN-5 TaxID=2735316 RepID=UPI0018776098|nr:RNase H family protein [Paenarthrobacter sp. YJN-5]QOT19432.1 ribonuclease H [Paenarthrobacter sp. YJN-5]
MTAVPMPAPPVSRFVPALVAVNERHGVTVLVDRQPNLCRWAVHTIIDGKDFIVSGPGDGQATNPSNREVATQISQAVARIAKRTGETPSQVFTSDWATAELLRAKSGLPITDLAAPPTALAAAREAVAEVERGLVSGLVLACDSSRGRGKSVNGCGYVLAYSNGADPILGACTSVSTHGGIRAGELAAIRRGLQSTLGHHPVLREGVGDLKVLTDSKAALDVLERVATGHLQPFDDTESVAECKRILGSARGVNISYEWVRGHNGHPLNELADRLAVLARRNREMGVDDVTNARMIASIRQDAKGVLLTEWLAGRGGQVKAAS